MGTKKPSLKKQIINIAVLLSLIGVTFFIIFRNQDGFSLQSVGDFITKIHWPFLVGAFLCMILNIGCKGMSIGVLSRALGYKKGLRKNYSYAAADIYFSAITPSATGGQPASAYYMVKDEIPISHTTAILSVNLLMYTASLMALSAVTFILRPNLFMNIDSWIVKVCIIVGLLVQLLFLSIYVLIMVSEKVVMKIAKVLVNLAALVRIVKDKEEYLGRIDASVKRFKNSVKLLSHNKKALFASFMCNFIERIVYISIGVLVFYGAKYNIPELQNVKFNIIDTHKSVIYEDDAARRGRRERGDLQQRLFDGHHERSAVGFHDGHHPRHQLLYQLYLCRYRDDGASCAGTLFQKRRIRRRTAR